MSEPLICWGRQGLFNSRPYIAGGHKASRTFVLALLMLLFKGACFNLHVTLDENIKYLQGKVKSSLAVLEAAAAKDCDPYIR